MFRADLEQPTSKERAVMKLVSLGKQSTQQYGHVHQPSRGTLESFLKSVAMSHQIHTYTELRQQIHDDLRIQHPEWVQPDGESAMCDFYEARLMELLDADAKGLS